MEAILLFPLPKVEFMMVPLTNGKAIVSKTNLQERLYQFQKDSSFVVQGLEDASTGKLMDVHESDMAMQFFILDANIATVYKVIIQNIQTESFFSRETKRASMENDLYQEETLAGEEIVSHATVSSNEPIIIVESPEIQSEDSDSAVYIDVSPLKQFSWPSNSDSVMHSPIDLSPIHDNVVEDEDFFEDPISTEDKQKHEPHRLQDYCTENIWKSSVQYLLQGKKSILQKLIEQTEKVEQVLEIPKEYDGNIIFEFPPTFGKIHSMDSMESKYDGHMWTKPRTRLDIPMCAISKVLL